MLSIMPFDRLASGQRESERPFKSYPRPSAQSLSALPYSPYGPPTFIGSVGIPAPHTKLAAESMDLRSSVQAHHPYHDMAASSSHQIKQEMDMHYHGGFANTYGSPHGSYPSAMSSMPMNMSSAASSLYSAGFGVGSSNGLVSGSNAVSGSHMTSGSHLVLPSQTTPTSPPLSSSVDKVHTHNTSGNGSTGSPGGSGSHSSGDASSPTTLDSSKHASKKRAAAVPEELKDDQYWDKRKKNNESAKRSREARRMKEEQIAMRVVYLEQENLQLRTEVGLLKSEIEKLRCMLYNS